MPSWGLSKYTENKLQTTCFYLIWSFFNNKKKSRTNLPASFSKWSMKENIYPVVFY